MSAELKGEVSSSASTPASRASSDSGCGEPETSGAASERGVGFLIPEFKVKLPRDRWALEVREWTDV